METLVLLEPRANLVRQGVLGQWVPRGQQDPAVSEDLTALRVLVDLWALLDPQVTQGLREHRDQMDQRELQEELVFLVLKDSKVCQELLVLQDQRVSQDQLVLADPQGPLDRQEDQGRLELLVTPE